jgi:galactokinase
VARSQYLTTHQLQNQVDETVFLAQTATDLGAAAGSAFGAGFGGSVWALTTADKAESFKEAWAAKSAMAFPGAAATSTFFAMKPGPGAFEVAAHDHSAI